MTNALILDKCMSRLGQRKSTRVREDVVTEINSAIVSLERRPFIPWFLEQTATLAVAVGDTFVALPTDFRLERENTRPYYVINGKVTYMTKLIAGKVAGYMTSHTSPQVYGIVGNNFDFRPAADKSYSIILKYYAATGGGFVDDSIAVSNLWLLNAEEWVLARALKMVARFHLMNESLAADFIGIERTEKQEIYKYHEAREHQNQDYIVGGATDGS